MTCTQSSVHSNQSSACNQDHPQATLRDDCKCSCWWMLRVCNHNSSHSQASLQSKLERAIANACNADSGDLENQSCKRSTLRCIYPEQSVDHLKSMLKTFVSIRPNCKIKQIIWEMSFLNQEYVSIFLVNNDDTPPAWWCTPDWSGDRVGSFSLMPEKIRFRVTVFVLNWLRQNSRITFKAYIWPTKFIWKKGNGF